MPPSRETLEKLLNRRSLSESESEDLLYQLTDPTGSQAMAGAVLAALRTKGVNADEVRGFAKGMRRLARRPQISPDVRGIDVVGTGGDSSGSVNISTGTALLTAACVWTSSEPPSAPLFLFPIRCDRAAPVDTRSTPGRQKPAAV